MPMLRQLGYSSYGDSYYKSKESVEKLIRYVTRTRINEDRADELISYGGAGVTFEYGIEYLISQIKQTQKVFDIANREGRRMIHEVYSFSEYDFYCLGNECSLVDQIARLMCSYYYSKGHEVIYAVHKDDEKFIHIHIVANCIRFTDGKKFDSSYKEYCERRQYFNTIYLLKVFEVNRIKQDLGIPIVPFTLIDKIKRRDYYGSR